MSVWKKYDKDQRETYVKFLQVYGSLTHLFRQKKGKPTPYLDSKYQETVFARSFTSKPVDIGNTPHDVLSVFGNERVGIGLKTWMGHKASYQKVMQLKRFQSEINDLLDDPEALVHKVSSLKNQRLTMDYQRLGLGESGNIYHYVTREVNGFRVSECAYPKVDLNLLEVTDMGKSSISWRDGVKEYRYTFGDSQVWQRFDPDASSSLKLDEFSVPLLDDPFTFLLDAYTTLLGSASSPVENFTEAYLPLYSYSKKSVPSKSALNAWNAKPKNKGSETKRPSREVYIPIPRDFHKDYPHFFTERSILDIDKERRKKKNSPDKPEVRFNLLLPNGKRIPALLTGDGMKGLQSGGYTEKGERVGQSALGEWLLDDVLGIQEGEVVTKEWLHRKGTDSVRLWRNPEKHDLFHIDFAPIGSFEKFMEGEEINHDEGEIF